MIKPAVRSVLRSLGYEIRKIPRAKTENNLYRPLYSPWLDADFKRFYDGISSRTLVSVDRCYIVKQALRQSLHVEGNILECGVYKGGTAALMAQVINESGRHKLFYLFDTFEGMPETNAAKDFHKRGDFSDTTLESVKKFVNGGPLCIYRKGLIPKTFSGLDNIKLAFAHVDVDVYRSVLDCLDFIWPRLSVGGIIVVDDYGFPTCPGARLAVDEFFLSRTSIPLCLQSGQAIVFKGSP